MADDSSEADRESLSPQFTGVHSVVNSVMVGDGAMAAQPANMPQISPTLPIGLYGWRKRCLYLLVLLLCVVLLVNLGLTVWILVALNFNTTGIGNVEITSSGIRIDGPSEFIGPLYAQNISTDQGSPLRLKSQQRVEVSANGQSHISVSPPSINISTPSFCVQTAMDQLPLLSVQDDEVSVQASQLQVTGTHGLSLSGPMETSNVRSPADQDLLIQSLSGQLQLQAGAGIHIEDSGARGEGVAINAREDITLTSENGQVILNSQEIVFQGLPRTSESQDGVYELCACSNGRLFLTPMPPCAGENICTGS